jgi:hypothetical protein
VYVYIYKERERWQSFVQSRKLLWRKEMANHTHTHTPTHPHTHMPNTSLLEPWWQLAAVTISSFFTNLQSLQDFMFSSFVIALARVLALVTCHLSPVKLTISNTTRTNMRQVYISWAVAKPHL